MSKQEITRVSFPIEDTRRIILMCGELLNRLLKNATEEELGGRGGGFLTVLAAHISLTEPFLHVGIGAMLPEKLGKYRAFSLEKAVRLASQTDDMSSAQSRNPEEGMWGGAIRSSEHNVIYSFSGLPEAADHTMMVALAAKVERWPLPKVVPYHSYLPDAQKWWDHLIN